MSGEPSPPQSLSSDPLALLSSKMAARPQFVPVNLDCLQVGRPLGFSLYVQTPKAGRIRFLEPQVVFPADLRRQLIERQTEVFVFWEERDKLRQQLELQLDDLVAGASQDSRQAARLAHELTQLALAEALDRPSLEAVHKADKVIHTTVSLIINSDQAKFTLMKLARHDHYTYVHSVNVGVFALSLLKTLMDQGVSADSKALGTAFYFHDIGKSEIAPELLNKPGPLAGDEEAQMRRHSELGAALLDQYQVLSPEGRLVVMQHHERFGGGGYPLGIKGEDIHLFSRVCTLADVYDALTSNRPYRRRFTPLDAFKIMLQKMPDHFDQHLLRLFVELFKQAAGQ